jgi:hypothetical protein
MWKNITILVLLAAVIVLAVFLGLCENKDCNNNENLSHVKKKKGCCVGCSTCKKYTEKAEQIMNIQGHANPICELEGILVDMRCYSQDDKNYTDKHFTPEGKEMPGCGKVCASRGIPVGLLLGGGHKPTGSSSCSEGECTYGDSCIGNVYILLTEAPKLSEYMGKWAKVKGRIMNNSGGLFTIEIHVKEGSEWKAVEIRTIM